MYTLRLPGDQLLRDKCMQVSPPRESPDMKTGERGSLPFVDRLCVERLGSIVIAPPSGSRPELHDAVLSSHALDADDARLDVNARDG